MKRALFLLLSLVSVCFGQDTARLQLKVESPEKAAVNGAEVWIWAEYVPGTPEILFTSRTNADGSLEAVVPVNPRFFHNVFHALVRSGDQVGVAHFYLAKGANFRESTATLKPTLAAKVRVLGLDGQPAAGVKLWVDACRDLDDRSPHFLKPPVISSIWTAITDAEGRAAIPNLPAKYAVHLAHDRIGFAQFKGRSRRLSALPLRSGKEEQTLTLEPGASISGRIILPDGTPVAGAEVCLEDNENYFITTASGPDGKFQVEGLPLGQYELSADCSIIPVGDDWLGPGVQKIDARKPAGIELGDLKTRAASIVTIQVVDAETGKTVQEPVIHRALPGETTIHYRSSRVPPPGYGVPPDLRLTLQEGERRTAEFRLPPVGVYSGTVRDAQGLPVKGAAVFGWFPGLVNGTPSYFQSDENGRFQITPPEGGPKSQWVILYASQDQSTLSTLKEVRAAPSDGHNLVFDPAQLGRLKGTVVDEAGQPVADATISWTPSEIPLYFVFNPRTTATDAEGRFEFPVVWSGLEVSIQAHKEGYVQRQRSKLTITPDQEAPVRVVLSAPKASVEGVVRRADGSPAAGIEVRAGGEGQADVSAETAADGTFRLQGLFPGPTHVRALEITAAASNYAGKWIDVGNAGPVELKLPVADGEIGGVIVNAAGQPVANADLRLFGCYREGRTDGQGRFKITGIMRGWTTLTVYPKGAETEVGRDDVRIKTGHLDKRIVLSSQDGSPPISVAAVKLQGTLAKPVRPVKWYNSTPLQPEKPPGVIRILDFWGTACAPCLASFPKVDKFWKEVSPGGKLELIAVTGDTNLLEVEELLAEKKYTFPVGVMAKEDRYDLDYDIRGIPLYVVIDLENRIVYSGHEWALAERKARELLGQ